jgi:hypothetical protein
MQSMTAVPFPPFSAGNAALPRKIQFRISYE